MERMLSHEEVRILGCLIEKEITTPDYYPLTLNALTNACNQKTNRDPVVTYTEDQLEKVLADLQEAGMVSVVHGSGSRVSKFRHRFRDLYDLDDREIALLCVLMLRGAQTPGELRGRSERLHPFGALEEIDETLQRLMEEDSPWITKLPRQVGRKERRFAHLLSGEPVQEETVTAAAGGTAPEAELSKVKEELYQLRREFDELKSDFEAFRRGLES